MSKRVYLTLQEVDYPLLKEIAERNGFKVSTLTTVLLKRQLELFKEDKNFLLQ